MPPELEAGDLARATRDALGPQGALAQADPQFVERDVQQQLAAAVADAVDTHATLVAEAGTGVGKTFAYLVPLLLSGRRALISTATKSLQDQLFLRDLPRLRDALRVPVRMALLKGRASYLCRHRLIQARVGAQLPDRFAVRALHRVAQCARPACPAPHAPGSGGRCAPADRRQRRRVPPPGLGCRSTMHPLGLRPAPAGGSERSAGLRAHAGSGGST